MSASRPTGVYKVKLKNGKTEVIEWQSSSECIVWFGSEEYGSEDEVDLWIEMIMPIKDWNDK